MPIVRTFLLLSSRVACWLTDVSFMVCPSERLWNLLLITNRSSTREESKDLTEGRTPQKTSHRRCWSSCNVETLTMKRLTDRNEWSTVKSHREVSNRRLTLQADSYSSPNSHIFYGTWSSSIFDRFFFSSGGHLSTITSRRYWSKTNGRRKSSRLGDGWQLETIGLRPIFHGLPGSLLVLRTKPMERRFLTHHHPSRFL